MVDAVAAFANDWSAVTNRAADITLIEAKGAGTIPFPPLVERMDRALATLWRGGDLSTMSKDGAAVGSNSQSGESDIIEQDDAQWVSEQLRLKLDRLVLDYTFGEGTPALAYVKVLTSAKPPNSRRLPSRKSYRRATRARPPPRRASPQPRPRSLRPLTSARLSLHLLSIIRRCWAVSLRCRNRCKACRRPST
jgi:hypothetical protein